MIGCWDVFGTEQNAILSGNGEFVQLNRFSGGKCTIRFHESGVVN